MSTIDDVLDGKYGRVRGSFRYERRDVDGITKQDVTSAIAGGSINLDNTRVTLRTASFVVNGSDFPSDWDWDDDFLQCFADIQDVDGSVVSFPLGLYQLSYPNQSLYPNSWKAQVSASDLTDRLARYKSPDPTVLSSGSGYVAAVRLLLDAAGLRHNIAGSPETTSAVFVWPPNTSRREIAAELAKGANYYPVWPDETGIFRLTPRFSAGNLLAVDSGLDFYTVHLGTQFHAEYSMVGEPAMIVGRPTLRRNPSPLANYAQITFTDPSQYAGTAGSGSYFFTNDDPDSLIALSKTEKRPIQDPGMDRIAVANQLYWGLYEVANQDAQTWLLEFTTTFDPRRTAHEYYRLQGSSPLPVADGVWMANSWTLPLNFLQPMTHKVALTRELDILVQAIL